MNNTNWRVATLLAFTGAVLAACGGGESGAESVSVPSGAPSQPPPQAAPPQVAPNTPPVISGSPLTTAVAGATYIFQAAATDIDGNPLTFAASGLPAWATLDAHTGQVYGTPSEVDVGTTANIVVSVSDGQATVSLPAFSIAIASSALPVIPVVVPPVVAPPVVTPPVVTPPVVTPPVVTPPVTPPAAPVNLAPTIAGTPSATVQATTAYGFNPSASDPESQPLAFSIANKPSWAAFSTVTGRLSGTPTATDVRAYSNIVITVSDGSLSTALPAFSITVTAAPNRAPTITGTAPSSVVANTSYSFSPAGSDPDGQTLTYSVSNKPSWASFSTSTGRLSGTPTSANVGTFSGITITASDGSLSASLAPFSITVSAAPNVAPTISGVPASSALTGSAYSFTPTASDADGDMLGFSITGKPSWASFSTATGQLTGTPAAGQTGTYSNIVISVSDGKVTRTLPAFSITVTQPAPTGTAALSWTAPTQNTDGSSLGDLAGYRVYHGTSASTLNETITLPGAVNTSYTFSQLSSGTHYFAVAAYNTSGVESAMSTVGSKSIQ